ncbi:MULTISPECIES: NAD-dependent epimerase/dehydratase family protein [unclassified Peribacillus]|uniref:NAD-dependent epimerase/dehydratase family protein n=1 Tax=unclassified Peribacillus TaxID=2675266 RepID=UPI00366B8E49
MRKKKILITGKGSYIGSNLIKWLNQWPDNYDVEELAVKTEEWKQINFEQYDAVLHMAGIAHVSADPKLEQLYLKVNRDLAIEVAKKAKKENVKQFIFMSSMIIYGEDAKIGENKIITKDTKPNPLDFYGRSKLEADLTIQELMDENFKTVIVRTPMVYGPNCKGNFPKLIKLAQISPIFPKINNERSMIFIENLCEFLKLILDGEKEGIFFPQNKEYGVTKDIIDVMTRSFGKKVYFISLFNPVLKLLSKKVNLINKVLGNKIYDKSISPEMNYCVVDFESSIKKSLKLGGK